MSASEQFVSVPDVSARTPIRDDQSVRLRTGTIIKELWRVTGKLGEGGCGVVYEVISLKNRSQRAALKVEPIGQHKDDEILKMEVFVLRKLQSSTHACRLLLCGKVDNYNYVVMTLLGCSLSDLRRMCPDLRLSTSTSLRLGLQCLEAIKHLHEVGFIHRDIKPSNFALGVDRDSRNVFILDFGLARQFLFFKNGQQELREPRRDVAFRGTVRYCSPNVHQRLEQGRHDDLWSLLYQLIEMITGSLPWRHMDRRASQELKMAIRNKKLMLGCPHEFKDIQNSLKNCKYQNAPDYSLFEDKMRHVMDRKKWRYQDPFDWEEGGRFFEHIQKRKASSSDSSQMNTVDADADVRNERDPSAPQTILDVEELEEECEGSEVTGWDSECDTNSAGSSQSDISGVSDGEDTLDRLDDL